MNALLRYFTTFDTTPRAFGLNLTWPQAWAMVVFLPLALLVVGIPVLAEVYPPRTHVAGGTAEQQAWAERRTACVADAMGFDAPPVHIASEINSGLWPDGGGVNGYYWDGEVVVKLTRTGYVSKQTLAHELAHAADMEGRWFGERALREKHGYVFAETLRRVYGAMVHCAENREKADGWDGAPAGWSMEFADGEWDAIAEDTCKPSFVEHPWLRM